MIIFEQQRLPLSEKTEQWRKNNVDAICSHADEFSDDWYRMYKNYRLKNNQIDQSEFREYCDTLGLQKGEGRKFVEPFNKTHTIIDVLKGEENAMPWNFDVINLAPKATNEILRDIERAYRNYMDQILTLEIEKSKKITQLMVAMKTEELDPQVAQEEAAKIEQEYAKKESEILNPEQIKGNYKNYKSVKEVAVHKLLRALAVENNLKWLKGETFEDATIAGAELVDIVVDEYTGIPKVKQVNPLRAFWHKSSDSPFVQHSEFAGYKEKITRSSALDRYGDHLSDKQIKKLMHFSGSIFGTDEKFHSPNGESVGHWDNMKKYEYGNKHPLSNLPYSTGSSNWDIDEGLYSSTGNRREYHNDYVTVYTTYWISQRRVGKYTFWNEYDKEDTTIVSEDFKVPKEATKVTYKPHTFSRKKTRYEWQDEQQRTLTLEWIWIPEVWKGVRINGDMHVMIEPYEHAYQSILNPYKVKLPLHGFIYNNRNAFSVSVMDRIAPWQKLYYVVASKWLKLITQDKGVVQLLNILMMDKKLGYKKSLEIAVDQGVLPFNPLAHSQGAGMGNTYKPAERLDLSNTQQLSHYTQMLQFIEQQIKLAAGIPDSRLAQTSSSTNVTDNQRDMAQSMNITNSLFKAHDLLWQEILQSLCETAVKSLDSKSGFIRQILSDEEIALIDLDLISLEDEYVIRIGNNTKAHEVLMQAKGFAQALIQNDKASFSTLLGLLDNTNLQEFKSELREIEDEIEQREAQMAQQQQQTQMQQMQMQEQGKEKDRQHELDKLRIGKEYDIKIAQIKAMSWNEDKDMDRDGLPDIFELEKFRNEAASAELQAEQKNRELDQQDRQLNAKERELGIKRDTDERNRQSQEKQAEADRRAKDKISQRQEQTKKQQAKAKANTATKK